MMIKQVEFSENLAANVYAITDEYGHEKIEIKFSKKVAVYPFDKSHSNRCNSITLTGHQE